MRKATIDLARAIEGVIRAIITETNRDGKKTASRKKTGNLKKTTSRKKTINRMSPATINRAARKLMRIRGATSSQLRAIPSLSTAPTIQLVRSIAKRVGGSVVIKKRAGKPKQYRIAGRVRLMGRRR